MVARGLWQAMAVCGVLVGCAGYGGSGLVPGDAGIDDVLRVMGHPAMEWTEADGSHRLAYPRGPMGVHTYMALAGPDGRLKSIENVLAAGHFARIAAGMGKAEVLKVLGPPAPGWTVYFPARDELVWEWGYCDDWNRLARFAVLFDGSREVVRSTMSLREEQVGSCTQDGCACAR